MTRREDGAGLTKRVAMQAKERVRKTIRSPLTQQGAATPRGDLRVRHQFLSQTLQSRRSDPVGRRISRIVCIATRFGTPHRPRRGRTPEGAGMSAIISPCGRYRYRLERVDAEAPLEAWARTAAVLMVNPSTADHAQDDQTIRKVRGFMRRAGYGRFVVGNLFAWRSSDIDDLRRADDPVGSDNDTHLIEIMRGADTVIVAWGRLAKLPPALRGRWRIIADLAAAADKPLHCLGTAIDGHPLHPLMTSYDRPLVPWERPDDRP